jgi:DNA-directed RNA polymerase subunit RPC12/RpoP
MLKLIDDGDATIECPYCLKHYGVEWASDDGQPQTGDYNIPCPHCGHGLLIVVYTGYVTY